MIKSELFISVLLLLLSCSSSCERKPGRPEIEDCYWLPQTLGWECQDAHDHVRPEVPGNLQCTTLDGYLVAERYIDSKEKKVRDLERQLAQCQANLEK